MQSVNRGVVLRYAAVLPWVIHASLASAGPLDQPLPANPCGGASLKLAFLISPTGTDFGGAACGSPGAGCLETVLVCTHVGKSTDPPIDVAVELFTGPGSLIPGIASECALAPGATAAFRTLGTLPLPYFGDVMLIGPQVPPGSMRVLSTDTKKIACDATLLDRSNEADTGLITTAMDVRITRAAKPQQGD